ncbi:CotO family spore coat protein [Salirhabdus salicampi]|uniref:CotO family spore coat protein n=1 Tax=Salirhabdus salicampi TaxID=476102 RepID=UPI0020C3135F|nr:CotO family spore coat protein [Salirhabdus salicampi]MCP8615603.1 spore coat CotO family protein [Salirhabdus salicampi]
MANEDRVVQKPLLYIAQPKEEDIEVSMQNYYYSRSLEKNNKRNDDGDDVNKPDESKGNRQKFRDLSIAEKVEYFLNMPRNVPQMKCELFTKEKRYTGYIVNYEDEEVSMRLFQAPYNVKITISEIDDIRLLGF